MADIDDVLIRKDKWVRFWRPRNDRMLTDEARYNRIKPNASRAGEEVITLNAVYTTVEKIANMIHSQQLSLRVDYVTESDERDSKEPSQLWEEILWWFLDEASQQFSESLNQPLLRQIGHWIALRGWLAARLTWLPNEDFPFDFQLFDPINVYPVLGRRRLPAVFHCFKSELTELEDEIPGVRALFTGSEDTAILEVTGFYDAEAHSLYGDVVGDAARGHSSSQSHSSMQQVIKARTKHDYGSVPWVIVIAQGSGVRNAPIVGSNQLVGTIPSTSEWPANMGQAPINALGEDWDYMNRVASQSANIIARLDNIPLIIGTDSQVPLEVDIGPGGRTQKGLRDTIDAPPGLMEGLPLVQSQLGMMQSRMDRAGVPPVLYGGVSGPYSGFLQSVAASSAQDFITPIFRAIESFLNQISRRVIQYLVNPELGLKPNIFVPRRGGVGSERMYRLITQAQLSTMGDPNRFKPHWEFKGMGLVDKAQRTQLGIMMKREDILSPYTVLDEYTDVKNPIEEERRKLEHKIKNNPVVIQAQGVATGFMTLRSTADELDVMGMKEEAAMFRMSADMLQKKFMVELQGGQGGPPKDTQIGPGMPEGAQAPPGLGVSAEGMGMTPEQLGMGGPPASSPEVVQGMMGGPGPQDMGGL